MDNSKYIEQIENHFKFLIIEVQKQLEDAQESLKKTDVSLIDRVRLRDDHIDNLKGMIEKKIYLAIFHTESNNKTIMDLTRSLNIITSNLERIGDFCVNIVDQLQYYTNRSFIKRYDYKAFFTEIFNAFEIIQDSIFKRDMSLAINICNHEYNLDILYKKNLEIILIELQEKKEVKNLVTTLFILRYLERIGDSLLNIGEAIMSSIIGEKLKIHQIRALGESLSETSYDHPEPDLSFETIGETRSGCKIGVVQLADDRGLKKDIIFKEGKRYKIEKEYENLIRWNEILPGLTPEIHRIHIHSLNASLLLEKLDGKTFQQVLLNEKLIDLNNILDILIKKITAIWNKTKIHKPIKSEIFDQISRRIDDIFIVHPSFDNPRRQICNLQEPGFKELLHRAKELEKQIKAPFSTFTHGDFNIDNIICDIYNREIYFIDVHRSGYNDYIQDICIFIISNFRLPVFNREIRDNINFTITKIYDFARSYSHSVKDMTFDMRFTLGIIRSFLTSTRFQLNDNFARSMYLRAIYLLKKIYMHEGDFELFHFPKSILYYDIEDGK